jgi:hypothetical protein
MHDASLYLSMLLYHSAILLTLFQAQQQLQVVGITSNRQWQAPLLVVVLLLRIHVGNVYLAQLSFEAFLFTDTTLTSVHL